MAATKTVMNRPKRWDTPMDSEMTESMVSWLLNVAPFKEMKQDSFAKSIPLRGILMNDCQLHSFQKGDIIIREGDYGNSAFLIIDGEAIVSLASLPANILGRQTSKQKGWFKALSQLWTNSKFSESRDYSKPHQSDNQIGSRQDQKGTHVFLQDIPSVLSMDQTAMLRKGEIFGEISALTRTPRTATIVANSDAVMLEIRWQGFRELLNRDEAMKQHVEKLYRENSLQSHLREIDLLKNLDATQLGSVAKATQFESFGDYQWNVDFKSTQKEDIAARILDEPVIALEGEYVTGMLLIRNGFVRISRKHGNGHQTVAYLGKGETFGLREIAHNWRTGDQHPWMLSMRAVGYVDILRIPTEIVEQTVLPTIPQVDLPALIVKPSTQQGIATRAKREQSMDRGLLEFLVEQRFINGTQAMMIDLDRCTRCDDCVRACANAHDNNPRFVRQGPKHDRWMIASACMHCLDPVCMIGCPTGAIGRDAETGTVTINDRTCIGCSTCSNSCPYQNIRMVDIFDRQGKPIVDVANEKPIRKATKCDLCVEQLGGPACQRACPHDALIRIDLSSPKDVTNWSGS